MKCVKSTILDESTYYYYDEKHEDIIKINFNEVKINNSAYRIDNLVYLSGINQYISLGVNLFDNIKSGNFEHIYKRSMYGYNSFTPINVSDVALYIDLEGICKGSRERVEITGNSFKDVWNHSFFKEKRWCLKIPKLDNYSNNTIINQLSRVNYSDLKLGGEYFSPENGKIIITNINKDINSEEKDVVFFEYKNIAGHKEQVYDLQNEYIYYLPYDDVKNPLNEINRGYNEHLLSPIAQKKDDKCIVFWNKIDEAACYHIRIFKNHNRYLYDIGEYTVDRSKRLFTIDNLLGEGYIFKVYAEDRNGEKISISRGIKLSSDNTPRKPQFMEG